MDANGMDAAAGAATPPPPSVPPVAGANPDVMSVSRGAFSDWNGDYHATIKDAQSFKGISDYADALGRFQQAGYSADQFGALMDAYVNEPDPNGQSGGMSSEAVQQMLAQNNENLLTQMGDKFNSALSERDKTVAADMQRQVAVQQAEKDKADYGTKLVEEMGHKVFDDEGKVIPSGMMFYREYLNGVYEAQQARMPEGLTEEQQREYYQITTPEDFESAKEKVQWLKDYRYQAAASVATQQARIPGETLGAGPSGKEPPPDASTMSDEQFEDEVMSDIDVPETPD